MINLDDMNLWKRYFLRLCKVWRLSIVRLQVRGKIRGALVMMRMALFWRSSIVRESLRERLSNSVGQYSNMGRIIDVYVVSACSVVRNLRVFASK